MQSLSWGRTVHFGAVHTVVLSRAPLYISGTRGNAYSIRIRRLSFQIVSVHVARERLDRFPRFSSTPPECDGISKNDLQIRLIGGSKYFGTPYELRPPRTVAQEACLSTWIGKYTGPLFKPYPRARLLILPSLRHLAPILRFLWHKGLYRPVTSPFC